MLYLLFLSAYLLFSIKLSTAKEIADSAVTSDDCPVSEETTTENMSLRRKVGNMQIFPIINGLFMQMNFNIVYLMCYIW